MFFMSTSRSNMGGEMTRECYGQDHPQASWVDGPCEICHIVTDCIIAIKVGYNGKLAVVCSPKCSELFIQRENKA
jgi:hypothetical protein